LITDRKEKETQCNKDLSNAQSYFTIDVIVGKEGEGGL
jgi:hypothetical protein